jgi:Flp pilus assembly protein TadG
MTTENSHCHPSQRGQSLVEIALLMPILIILFLGIAEVGFYLFSHVQVANAARSGARAGSLCRLYQTCSDANFVPNTVRAEAPSLKTDNMNIQAQPLPFPSGTTPAVGSLITVTVTYSHTSPFISNFIPMFPKQLPVRHTVVMHFDK